MRIFPLSAALLSVMLPAYSQQPAAPPPTLKLFVLQGNNAINDVLGRSVAVSTPIVEVRDLNDLPVEGAEVIFELPANGPGGSFPGNKITFNTRTTVQGQASAPFTPNTLPGRFSIQVTATAGDRFGRIVIQQTNANVVPGTGDLNQSHSSRKKWLILAGVGAAAGITIGLVLANHSSAATPTGTIQTPPVIVITPGPPVFGGR